MRGRSFLLGLLALVLVSVALFSGTLRHEFVNWDDDVHITGNPHVVRVDWAGIFSEPLNSVYHPITDLSWVLESQLFGFDPFYFHLDNVLLHALDTVLVALLLAGLLPGPPLVPLLGALLFAIHPLQVESVAWATGRKDLLSTAFYLGALLVWRRASLRGAPGRYALVLVLAVLALLAKPSAISLPAVLALTDWCRGRSIDRRRALELLPVVALALALAVHNLLTQAPPEDISNLPLFHMSWPQRLWIGVQAVVFYVSKFLAPLDLSVYYDVHFVRPAAYQYALAAAAAVCACAWALRHPADRRIAAFGVLFFLVTLAPVSKVIPFSGNSLFNDRYMYLPCIGLVVLLALPLRRALEPGGRREALALVACGVAAVALASASWQRSQVWRNSETLWASVIELYPRTAMAHYKLGRALYDRRGDAAGAVAELARAAELEPAFAVAHLRMGEIEADRGATAAAAAHFERFVEQAPRDVGGRAVVANFYATSGELAKAVLHFEAAARLNPDSAAIQNNLGVVLRRLSEFDRAEAALQRATRLAPDDPTAWANLGALHLEKRERRRARRAYAAAEERGFEIDPGLRRRLGSP